MTARKPAKPQPKSPLDRVPKPEAKAQVETDAPMPAAENDPPCYFKPGPGVTTMDVHEITLMYLLQLSGSDAVVAPGALRTQLLSAERVAQLSPQARQFMNPAVQAPTREDETS